MDYSDEKEPKITTTIDCYVSGTYVTSKGKVFSIRERFSITVTYSNSTIIETMARVRELLISKFEQENPEFKISDIFIPELRPEMKRIPEPTFVYRGGKVFRYMTRLQEGRLVLGTERDIYKSRARRIIEKYGLKRREGIIKRL